MKERGRRWPVRKGQNKEMVLHSEGNWKPQKVFRLESEMSRVALYGESLAAEANIPAGRRH